MQKNWYCCQNKQFTEQINSSNNSSIDWSLLIKLFWINFYWSTINFCTKYENFRKNKQCWYSNVMIIQKFDFFWLIQFFHWFFMRMTCDVAFFKKNVIKYAFLSYKLIWSIKFDTWFFFHHLRVFWKMHVMIQSH